MCSWHLSHTLIYCITFYYSLYYSCITLWLLEYILVLLPLHVLLFKSMSSKSSLCKFYLSVTNSFDLSQYYNLLWYSLLFYYSLLLYALLLYHFPIARTSKLSCYYHVLHFKSMSSKSSLCKFYLSVKNSFDIPHYYNILLSYSLLLHALLLHHFPIARTSKLSCYYHVLLFKSMSSKSSNGNFRRQQQQRWRWGGRHIDDSVAAA